MLYTEPAERTPLQNEALHQATAAAVVSCTHETERRQMPYPTQGVQSRMLHTQHSPQMTRFLSYWVWFQIDLVFSADCKLQTAVVWLNSNSC